MKALKDKVALVTGGSRGIGAAIAKRLARDGAQVAISYSASKDQADAVVRELEQAGVKAAAFQADQADPRQVAELVQAVVKRFGRLDILVNNAGVFVTGTVDNTEAEVAAFDRQLAINIGGVAAAVRAAANVLKEGGRIISIGSGAADRSGFPGMSDYSATKAAIAAYTRGWARDFGKRGITVNIVQPGPINTEMNPDNTDFATLLKANTALGRYGTAEEVAGLVAFVAGPEASYITGASLDVDGGYGA